MHLFRWLYRHRRNVVAVAFLLAFLAMAVGSVMTGVAMIASGYPAWACATGFIGAVAAGSTVVWIWTAGRYRMASEISLREARLAREETARMYARLLNAEAHVCPHPVAAEVIRVVHSNPTPGTSPALPPLMPLLTRIPHIEPEPRS